MVAIKGVPNITGQDNPLTNMKGVDMQNPWLQTLAFDNLYLIFSFNKIVLLFFKYFNNYYKFLI